MKLTSPQVLQALMAQHGLSHRGLAKAAGLSSGGMVDHLIAGRRTSCSPYLASRIAAALHVPTAVLFVPKTSSAARRPSSIAGEDAA